LLIASIKARREVLQAELFWHIVLPLLPALAASSRGSLSSRPCRRTNLLLQHRCTCSHHGFRTVVVRQLQRVGKLFERPAKLGRVRVENDLDRVLRCSRQIKGSRIAVTSLLVAMQSPRGKCYIELPATWSRTSARRRHLNRLLCWPDGQGRSRRRRRGYNLLQRVRSIRVLHADGIRQQPVGHDFPCPFTVRGDRLSPKVLDVGLQRRVPGGRLGVVERLAVLGRVVPDLAVLQPLDQRPQRAILIQPHAIRLRVLQRPQLARDRGVGALVAGHLSDLKKKKFKSTLIPHFDRAAGPGAASGSAEPDYAKCRARWRRSAR